MSKYSKGKVKTWYRSSSRDCETLLNVAYCKESDYMRRSSIAGYNSNDSLSPTWLWLYYVLLTSYLVCSEDLKELPSLVIQTLYVTRYAGKGSVENGSYFYVGSCDLVVLSRGG